MRDFLKIFEPELIFSSSLDNSGFLRLGSSSRFKSALSSLLELKDFDFFD